jgi:hypothetical protein
VHKHPSDVSGKMHRLGIWQAVMFLAKFAEWKMSLPRQRWVIREKAIASIASLLTNPHNLDLQVWISR